MSNKKSKYKTSWDLSPLLKNDNDPKYKKQMVIVEKEATKFAKKWKDRDDYLEEPSILLEAITDYENWSRDFGTSGDYGFYFHLREAQDLNDKKVKAINNQVTESSTKIANEIQFFDLRVSKIAKSKQNKFLNYKGLSDYKHYLETLFAQEKHQLSEAEEKIMNLKSPMVYSNWTDMVSGFISNEEYESIDETSNTKTAKNLPELLNLTQSKKKKVRDNAAEGINHILAKHSDVAEHELNSILQNKKVDDELRNFDRPDSSRHLVDDISTKVVDQLIKSVTARNNIPKRYYKLKAKLLGVDKLAYHERNIEYGKINQEYTYDKSVDLVASVFKDLDPEFENVFLKFVRNGNIDVYPSKGKRGGAFCSTHGLKQPTYILLNHTGNLNDVNTLAHEVGHGIHSELMRKYQNELNFDVSMATAEVASTFMEDFVLERIISESNEEERLAIMMMKLNDDVSTIFRQIACYQFEQDLHMAFREKGYLPKEEIGGLFQNRMKNYMGKYVEQSEGSENWWVYWSHIRYFFYVYSYSSGLLISKSLQNSVKNDPKSIEMVKEFMSAGVSASPENIFKNIGIDITKDSFWDAGLAEIDALLKQTEKLAKKIGKI